MSMFKLKWIDDRNPGYGYTTTYSNLSGMLIIANANFTLRVFSEFIAKPIAFRASFRAWELILDSQSAIHAQVHLQVSDHNCTLYTPLFRPIRAMF